MTETHEKSSLFSMVGSSTDKQSREVYKKKDRNEEIKSHYIYGHSGRLWLQSAAGTNAAICCLPIVLSYSPINLLVMKRTVRAEMKKINRLVYYRSRSHREGCDHGYLQLLYVRFRDVHMTARKSIMYNFSPGPRSGFLNTSTGASPLITVLLFANYVSQWKDFGSRPRLGRRTVDAWPTLNRTLAERKSAIDYEDLPVFPTPSCPSTTKLIERGLCWILIACLRRAFIFTCSHEG